MLDEMIVPQQEISRRTEFVMELLNEHLHIPPSGVVRRLFGGLVRRPVQSFVRLFDEMDGILASQGMVAASRHGLKQFAARLNICGVENIPGSGPLLIVSNHVGAFDMLAITSQVNRNDVKIIAGEVALLRNFPALQQRLIFTTFQPGSGMQAARQALRHLRDGGALLLFASAGIDPDPALDLQTARQELQKWKPSIDIFLQYAPETKVVVSIVRGVAAAKWARHPLTRIGKRPIDQRRIGEILQILEQLFFPGRRMMEPRICFSRTLTSAELAGDARAAVIRIGEEMLSSRVSL